jgi:virulence-associated protein VagC
MPSPGERRVTTILVEASAISVRRALAFWYRLVSIMATAKIFRNGRSQAVRLPKEFRFEGQEVNIRRSGKKVILEPKKRRPWPRDYWKSWGSVPKDFRAPQPLAAGRVRVGFDAS